MNKGKVLQSLNLIEEYGKPTGVDGHADRLVGSETIFGPLSGQDVRMYLDGHTLERLMEVAKESMVGRVELLGVGVRIKIWEADTGHRYTTWELISQAPQPEKCVFDKGPK